MTRQVGVSGPVANIFGCFSSCDQIGISRGRLGTLMGEVVLTGMVGLEVEVCGAG